MDNNDLRERLQRVPVPESEQARERAARVAVATAGASPAPLRQRSQRLVRIVALSVLGAAILIAVGVFRGSGQDPRADGFYAYASLAAEQPSSLQYVSWESELRYERPDFYAQGARYPDAVRETTSVNQWADAEQRYEISSHHFWDGSPKTQGGESLYDRSTGVYCYLDPLASGKDKCTSLSFQLGPPDLPTEPDALRGALEKLIDPTRGSDESTSSCTVGDSFGAPLPQSMSAVADRQVMLTDLRVAAGLKETSYGTRYSPPAGEKLFSLAAALLAEPTSSPELRATLFQVLANLRGARLAPEGEDQTGREASIIEYSTPPADPNSTRAALDQVFVDPATSEVLEQRTTVQETRPGSSEPETVGTYDRLFEDRADVEELPGSATPLVSALDRATADC